LEVDAAAIEDVGGASTTCSLINSPYFFLFSNKFLMTAAFVAGSTWPSRSNTCKPNKSMKLAVVRACEQC
jgi:hypothetical protein